MLAKYLPIFNIRVENSSRGLSEKHYIENSNMHNNGVVQNKTVIFYFLQAYFIMAPQLLGGPLSRISYLDRGYVTLLTANHCARSYKKVATQQSITHVIYSLYPCPILGQPKSDYIFPILPYSLCSYLIFYCVLCSCSLIIFLLL